MEEIHGLGQDRESVQVWLRDRDQLSPLRSSKESVSGGGIASGPLSFMKGLDVFDHVIVAADAACGQDGHLGHRASGHRGLHRVRALEDKKAQALMREGYDGTSGRTGVRFGVLSECQQLRARERSIHVRGENDLNFCTLTVKTREEVENYRARNLMHKIAQAT